MNSSTTAGHVSALKRAGIPAKKNGWRHSFPSHFAARDQSAELAAYLLQHKNAKLLYETYRGNAS